MKVTNKKILYITTISTTMRFFESFITELTKMGNNVEVATNVNLGTMPSYVAKLGLKVHNLSCVRSALSLPNMESIKQIKNICKNNNYDIVHCHTPIAGFCTRLACKSLRKKGLKVIYTAHGFHFYKGAPLKNWLLYFPAEWIASFFTDCLITINEEDYQRAKAKFHAKSCCKIPGIGIDIKQIQEKVSSSKYSKEMLGFNEKCKVLLSVGELNKNKNHQIVLRAISAIKNKDIHYFIAGDGPERENLLYLAKDLGIQNQLHLLGYVNNVTDYLSITDLFVFPSIREGFGLSLLEAVAGNVYSIASNCRGPKEILRDPNDLFDTLSVDSLKHTLCKALDLSTNNQKIVRPILEYDSININKLMLSYYKKTLNISQDEKV